MSSSVRHIKIFISSTFQDMKEEREVLLKETFLELKKIAKERFIEITEIDLRTGITQEQEQSGEIVKVCLDEIQRCSNSPIFFLGILGNRYGWDKWAQYISKNTLEDSRYRWIKKHLDKSVTQLEILSAIEQNPTKNRAFFYLKEGENDNKKLTLFKNHLIDKAKTNENILLTQYKDIKEFRDKTIQVFTETLDELFPPDKNPGELERLRAPHDIFARSRQKIYIPHKKNEIILSEFLSSDQDRLLLYGESGYGKSALIANYFKDYNDAFVITHFIGGAGKKSNDIYQMLRRIMLEIKEEFKITDDLPNEPQKIVEGFALWLQKVKRSTIIILDGYNQIEDKLKEKLFSYLPKKLENIKLIITSIKNAYPIDNSYQIGSLNQAEQKNLIVDYLKEYGKAIDVSTQDKIVAHKQTNNALFLRALLNEIRLLGNFDNLQKDIDNYLEAKDTVELFIKIFERLEKDYKEHLTEEVLSLLYISRDGLSEDNLIDIINQNCSKKLIRYEFSPLFLALEQHLIDNNGLYGFFHDYIREAVKRKYLNTQEMINHVSMKIVLYFESSELDVQKVRELPYHLYHLQDRDGLYTQLLDIAFFYTLLNIDRYELLVYMRYIDKRYDIAKDVSDRLLDNWAKETQVLHEIAIFMRNEYARYNLSLLLHQKALEINKKVLGEEHPDTAVNYSSLGQLYFTLGDYPKAEPFYLKALEISKKILGEEHRDTAVNYNNLGQLYFTWGNYPKAEPFYLKALGISKKILGEEHPDTAKIYTNLGQLYFTLGDYPKAEPFYLKALEISKKVLGEEHPDTAVNYNNLGQLYFILGDYPQAYRFIKQALSIGNKIFPHNHPHLLIYKEVLAMTEEKLTL